MRYRSKYIRGGDDPVTPEFKTVIYDMTNVDPENREKINHQLNEIYSRNVMDKNKPLESFLVLHVLDSEKENVSRILTSEQFRFEPVEEGSEKFNMIANKNEGKVNAVVTRADQIVPSSAPAASLAMTSAVPIAATASEPVKQLSAKESLEESLNRILVQDDYAKLDGIKKIIPAKYEELSTEYGKLIDLLPADVSPLIRGWVPLFDCRKIYNIPNVNIFEDFAGFDYDNPKSSFSKIRDSIKAKGELFEKQEKEYYSRYDKLSKEKHGFFTLRKDSKIEQLDEVLNNIKKTIMEPIVSKENTNDINYMKENTRSTIYLLQNQACAALGRYIMMILIKYNNDSTNEYMNANQYNSSDLATARSIQEKIFNRKKSSFKDFFTGSVDDAYVKTLGFYKTMLDKMAKLIKSLSESHNKLYDRYNRLYTYIYDLKAENAKKERLRIGGRVGGRISDKHNHRRRDSRQDGRNVRQIPYRARQYTPLITSRKKNKHLEKKKD